VFQLGDQRYVVAKLSGINEKGLMAITPANRAMLQQRVADEKKAAAITAKYKGATSLDAIASGSGQQVAQSDSVMLAGAYIPGLGYEPKVVGYTFSNTSQRAQQEGQLRNAVSQQLQQSVTKKADVQYNVANF